MTTRTACSHLTRRGRPCRNPAAPGTEPPACATHRRATTAEQGSGGARGQGRKGIDRPATGSLTPDLLTTDPLTTDPPAAHFYFPRPTADERRALAAMEDEAADLQPEVDLVRIVLRRLLAWLDEAGGELSPEELRRVSGLVFTGARTVAQLLGRRAAPAADAQPWLAAALEEMGEALGREL